MEMNGQLHRVMVSLLMLLIIMGQVSIQSPFPGSRPRCSNASQPCRLKAVLHVQNPMGPSVIATSTCSCSSSLPSCSEDWDSNSGKKLVQELRTEDNNNITLSMMFCVPRRPQRRCRRGQVALQLGGFVHIPMEVESINCRCPNKGHLVFYQKYTDDQSRQLFSYICASQQRVCTTERTYEGLCLIEHLATGNTTYPCRCPRRYSCTHPTPRRGDPHYRCRRSLNRPRKNN